MAFEVFRSPEDWRNRFGGSAPATVLSVGNFDGIHLGHQKILRHVVERARASAALATIVTFDPHPVKVLRPETAPPLIFTLEQRLKGIEQMGLDAALVLRFDLALSRLSPKEFVEKILVDTLRVRAILVGPNFRFGYRQAGNVARLRQLGKKFGFSVETIPAIVIRGVVVSSTAIRKAVSEGRVERARLLLGRPFTLTGPIRPGTGQGRHLVVPTLNLSYQQELVPRRGVYASETVVGGRVYRSATNVGIRPTFDGGGLTVESHLLEFSETLTSGSMELRFWKRLRNEKKFPSVDSLRAQVLRDIERAARFFSRLDARWTLSRRKEVTAVQSAS